MEPTALLHLSNLMPPAQWLFVAAALMYVGISRDIVAEVRGL
ncbi:hypothetical protein [Kribbella sp. NPDC051718]